MTYHSDMHELWKQGDEKQIKPMQWNPSIAGSSFFEKYFLIDNCDCQVLPVYILPDICPHIIVYEFYSSSKEKIQIKLVGPRTTGFLIDRENRKRTFILRLKPSAFYQLFNMPASLFTNRSEILTEVLSSVNYLINELQQLLSNQVYPYQIFRTIENILIKHRIDKSPKVLSPFFEFISNDREVMRVQSAANYIGVSERYLRKVCTQQVGLSPKQIIRINRFTHSLKKRLQYPNYSWSDVAHLSGYVDQSHLIAEYQQLMSRTPVQLFIE